MNTLKIQNTESGETFFATYPTAEKAAKAKSTIKRIGTCKVNVPCDVESGKTQKLTNFKNWSCE